MMSDAMGVGDSIFLFGCMGEEALPEDMGLVPIWIFKPGEGCHISGATSPIGACVTTMQNGEILIAGGMIYSEDMEDVEAINSAYILSPSDMRTRSVPNLTHARLAPMVETIGTKSFVLGGISGSFGSFEMLNSVECLESSQGGEQTLTIPERIWHSTSYDLGAAYELSKVGWSGAGKEAPSLTLSYSLDGTT